MFQVEVLDGGPEVFNYMTYSEKHPSTLQYLKSQFTNIGQTLTEAGKSFFDGARQVFEAANSSEAMRRARLATSKVRSIFERDEVKSLFELHAMQASCLTMQRWIMAEPTVRQMYHDQRCDGFSETYIDMSPGQIGENHYDYRRVMHGMVQDDVDPEGDWKTSFYLDEIHEGDRELTFEEQIDIISTWDAVKAFMARGKDDPTSQFANML